ncbi:hypothetical protein RISK_002460 [Rhodopirellula islandica]|uniref:Uncharacterized protein n=1 Tax=Rhodopirellula islandica TaxID=595434 RepID=A0A0J1BGY9_RHOIS|nr:hypothetical protein RISK_002460 [Rhodopirellula islandica]
MGSQAHCSIFNRSPQWMLKSAWMPPLEAACAIFWQQIGQLVQF